MIGNPSEYQYYLDTSRKINDKNLYIKYIFDNIIFDELDKLLKDHISTHNKKFVFYFISCELIIEFDITSKENIETNYYYNTDIINIKRDLIYKIYLFLPKVFKDCHAYKIKHTIRKTTNDRCNMTYKYYKNLPMSMVERRLNIYVAKNPELINSFDRTKNHPLIRKYSHLLFNN